MGPTGRQLVGRHPEPPDAAMAHPSSSSDTTGRLEGRAGLIHRPAAERFHSQHDWLDSWHSFSFAGHDHPAWRGFGPLRVINDDRIAAGRGFGLHPHRDMEIITVMVEGVLTHEDSMGHRASLQAGEVQRMSAGRGLLHSEVNAGAEPCRLLQIWIEPSAYGTPPSYEQKPFLLDGGWTLLIDPERRDGAMAIQGAVRLWRAQPQGGGVLALPLAAEAPGWLQLISGSGRVELSHGAEAVAVQAGDGLGMAAGQGTAFTAGPDGADLLVFKWHPHHGQNDCRENPGLDCAVRST